MAEQQAVIERKGREGGRWINERPTSDEFGAWFKENMKLDAALRAEDYVGGVVLIPAVDAKAKIVVGFRNGVPLIEEREELSYIPYAKVETRINYFWDLLDAHSTDWVGSVAPDTLSRLSIEGDPIIETSEGEGRTMTKEATTKPSALASMVYQLPTGFSIMSVPVADRYSHFLCCTMRVAIWDREEWKALTPAERKELAGTGIGALRTGRGTKQVPMLMGRSTPWADPNSLMKSETGALGRALGFAGIFVIPGSGVATAEDMQESAAQGQTVAQDAEVEATQGPSAPDVAPARTGAEAAVDEETALRKRAAELYKALSENHKEVATEFGQWASSRQLTSLGDARGAMLVGVVRKLEKLTDRAENPPPEEVADVLPAETPPGVGDGDGVGDAQPSDDGVGGGAPDA